MGPFCRRYVSEKVESMDPLQLGRGVSSVFSVLITLTRFLIAHVRAGSQVKEFFQGKLGDARGFTRSLKFILGALARLFQVNCLMHAGAACTWRVAWRLSETVFYLKQRASLTSPSKGGFLLEKEDRLGQAWRLLLAENTDKPSLILCVLLAIYSDSGLTLYCS